MQVSQQLSGVNTKGHLSMKLTLVKIRLYLKIFCNTYSRRLLRGVVVAYILCMTLPGSAYSETRDIVCYQDQDLFFPILCDGNGDNCSPSTRSVTYNTGTWSYNTRDGSASISGPCRDSPIFDKDEPHNIRLADSSSIPGGITYENTRLTWAPTEIPEEDPRIEFIASGSFRGQPHSHPFTVTLKSYNDSSPNGKNDWQRICDRSIRAWRLAQTGNTGDPTAGETPNPSQNTPTEYFAFATLFERIIAPDRDIESILSKEQRLLAGILWREYRNRLLSKLNIRPTTALKNAIMGLTLTIPQYQLLEFNKKAAPYLAADPRNPLQDYDRFVGIEFRKLGLLGEMLAAWINRSDLGCPSPSSGLGPRYQIFETAQEELKAARGGIDQPSLYFLYLMSKPELNGLYFYHGDRCWLNTGEIQAKLAQQKTVATELMRQKTTPFLACNNAASDYSRERIPWEKLGMDSYTPGILWLGVAMPPWLSWPYPWITRNIGRSMYEHPEAWELSKALPVFGQALSIADGALTLYSGVDLQGKQADRAEAAAMLAFDVAASAFDVYGLAKGLARYREIAREVRSFKQAQRVDNVVEGLDATIDYLKTELKYANDGVIDLPPCALNTHPAASLESNAGQLSPQWGNTLLGQAGVCLMNRLRDYKKFVKAGGVGASADANAVTNLGEWEEAMWKAQKHKSATGDRRPVHDLAFDFLPGNKDNRDHFLMKQHITVTALAYREFEKIHGINTIIITPPIARELTYESNYRRLLNLDQWKLLTKARPNSPGFPSVRVATSRMLEMEDELRNPKNAPFFAMMDQLYDLLKRARFGMEDGKNSSILDIRYRGDHSNFARSLTGYRVDGSVPVVPFTDMKSALDALKLGTGRNLLGKLEDRDSIRAAYKQLLEEFGNKKVRLTLSNQNLRAVGVIDETATTDLSNLPIDAVFLPLNCGHTRIPAIRAGYPELITKTDEITNFYRVPK